MEARKKNRGNFVLSTHRTGRSTRLGRPLRQIVRPKRYVTTSSDNREKVKRNRKAECNQSEQTTDIENDINEIRNEVNINKENEANRGNILTEHVSPDIFNNSEPPLSNSTAQLYNPPNVTTETCKQSLVHQRTYTELLPPSSNFNVHATQSTSTFPRSTSNPHMHASHTGIISYNKSFPHTSLYEPLSQQHEAHYFQGESSRVTPIYHENNYDQNCGSRLQNSQHEAHYFQEESRVTPSTYRENNFDQSSGSRSRNKEMERLHEKLDNVVSKEDFEFLRDELNKYYKTVNEKLDKLLRKRTNVMPPKPSSFPLKSVQEVENFNNISEEEYENAVEYLHYLGGFTLHDAVKFCMKEAVTDDAIRHYSAWGEHGNLPLFDTKLIKVVYDAVCRNSNFQKPLRDEFFREVGEAVRFGKQRNRNIIKRKNEIGRGGRRQRLRREAEDNLLGEYRIEANIENAVDTDNADDGDQESI